MAPKNYDKSMYELGDDLPTRAVANRTVRSETGEHETKKQVSLGEPAYIHNAKWMVRGFVMNRLRIVGTVWENSEFYERMYFTGYIDVECLGDPNTNAGCGKTMRVKSTYFRKDQPNRSKYSCGCCKRPRKPGKAKRRRLANFGGRPPCKILDLTFGKLDVITRIPTKGWLCKCACGDANVVVPRSYQLLRGTVTGCAKCKPSEWLKAVG